jgi:hypothetical protein
MSGIAVDVKDIVMKEIEKVPSLKIIGHGKYTSLQK